MSNAIRNAVHHGALRNAALDQAAKCARDYAVEKSTPVSGDTAETRRTKAIKASAAMELATMIEGLKGRTS